MKKLGLLGCTLAVLGASTTASAQFQDCTSASNSGFNLTQFYVSAVMNTIGCEAESSRLQEGEELLQRLLGQFSLPASMPRDQKVCYVSGFHEGYQSALLEEYRECRSVPSAETLGAAAGAVTQFAISELGDAIAESELSAVFDGRVKIRLRSDQLDCQARLLDVVGGASAPDVAFEAAVLACAGN